MLATEDAAAPTYPGELMSANDVLTLAQSYRECATHLLTSTEHRCGAPARLLTIHAIELYLNAYLLANGDAAPTIRAMQHDLRQRTNRAVQLGLALRQKTITHLEFLSRRREYLVSRYATLDRSAVSQINRLEATLEELHRKVGQRISAGNEAEQA